MLLFVTNILLNWCKNVLNVACTSDMLCLACSYTGVVKITLCSCTGMHLAHTFLHWHVGVTLSMFLHSDVHVALRQECDFVCKVLTGLVIANDTVMQHWGMTIRYLNTQSCL